jgi:hypothetical protein
MPSTGFQNKPYIYTKENVEQLITKISSGAYALGKIKDNGTFIINYVGRSDDNLAVRLATHEKIDDYTHLKYGYCSSIKEAFEKECNLYHDFGENKLLDNKVHPAKPNNTTYKCPRCGQ